MEIQFTCDDPKTNILDLSDKLAPLSANCSGWEVTLNSKDSVSMSVDGDFSTEPFRRPRFPFVGPLKSRYPPKKTSTYSSTPQSILSFVVYWRFIIALLFIFRFSYLHPSFFVTDTFSFHKYLSSEDWCKQDLRRDRSK